MIDPTSIPGGGSQGPDRVQPEPALPSQDRTSAEGSGVAFKALLEQLEGKAREAREQQSHAGVEHPDELAGAADEAKASITDALNLRDQLLEAFRAAQQGEGDKQGS